MRVKVKSVFIDKYTNEKYSINQELSVTQERYKEIKKYVDALKTKKGQE